MKHFSFYIRTGAIAGLIQFAFYPILVNFQFTNEMWIRTASFFAPILFVVLMIRTYRQSALHDTASYGKTVKLLVYPLVFCAVTANLCSYLYDIWGSHSIFNELRLQKFLWSIQYGPETPFDPQKYIYSPIILSYAWQILIDSFRFMFVSLLVAIFLKKENKSAAG
jgi:hypothetical protein